MPILPRERAQWVARNLLPHEPDLRAWLSRRVKPPLEVDDIVQETYAVFGALETVEHIRSPRNYMFQTAYSLLVVQIRRATVVPFESLSGLKGMEFVSDHPSPEQDALARHELRRVKSLIDGLPPRQREAFALLKIEGLSQKEIARRMGVSLSTVEKHLAKAVAALVAAIGQGGKAPARVDEAPQLGRRQVRETGEE
jgi:RNA polymerase sigma factor (sigma-70 family)